MCNLICLKCNRFKHESEFGIDNRKKNRNFKHSYCKECNTKVTIFNRHFNKKSKDFSLDKYFNYKVNECRNRSKKVNRYFDLTKEDLFDIFYSQKGLCAITKIPMTFNYGNGRCVSNLSIDRIDSSLGYTKLNIQLVCDIINTMKSNLSSKDFVRYCKLVVDNV